MNHFENHDIEARVNTVAISLTYLGEVYLTQPPETNVWYLQIKPERCAHRRHEHQETNGEIQINEKSYNNMCNVCNQKTRGIHG